MGDGERDNNGARRGWRPGRDPVDPRSLFIVQDAARFGSTTNRPTHLLLMGFVGKLWADFVDWVSRTLRARKLEMAGEHQEWQAGRQPTSSKGEQIEWKKRKREELKMVMGDDTIGWDTTSARLLAISCFILVLTDQMGCT